MTGEGDLLGGGAAYGLDPLAPIGEELRERAVGAEGEAETLVLTEEVQQSLTMVAPWLKNREPFILVGCRSSVVAVTADKWLRKWHRR